VKIEEHVRKWQRFDSVRSRLHPIDEFELWYWSMLSGAMALINAALHAWRITAENDLFATQTPNVYIVIESPEAWHYEIGVGGDLIHLGLPAIDAPMPAPLQPACDAMLAFESYRDDYVRGDKAVTEDIVANCESAYRIIVTAAAATIAGKA
jgi:hypothetical protein